MKLSENSYYKNGAWVKAALQSRVVRVSIYRDPEWRYRHETVSSRYPGHWWGRAIWWWFRHRRRWWHWQIKVERSEVEVRP